MDWSPVWVSVRASLTATVFVALLGTVLGYLLAKGRFPGRRLLEVVATAPIALPPTVLGYYLLLNFAANGIVGGATYRLLGHPLAFTFEAIVIAAGIEALPYHLRLVRAAIADVDPRLEQAARTLGLPEWKVALNVTLPAARRGILAGLAMAFARALGDFGATSMVAGTSGATFTAPLAIFSAALGGTGRSVEARDLAVAQTLLALFILLVVSRLVKTSRA